MSRLYLRLLMLPLLIFTAALLLIRAQPYDDHELRQLLLPDGCPAPCFMGIRPGVTGRAEAGKLLDESGWMEAIIVGSETDIMWSWNGRQPPWIEPMSAGYLFLNNDQVTKLRLDTRFSLGNILLSYRIKGVLNQTGYEPGQYALYSLYYPERHLRFDFRLDCQRHVPYNQPVSIMIGTDLGYYNADSNDKLQKPFRCSG